MGKPVTYEMEVTYEITKVLSVTTRKGKDYAVAHAMDQLPLTGDKSTFEMHKTKMIGESEPSRFLSDMVHLSNKHCRKMYMGAKCDCPSGRCWYEEQQRRCARQEGAISPQWWPEEEGDDT